MSLFSNKVPMVDRLLAKQENSFKVWSNLGFLHHEKTFKLNPCISKDK